MTFMVDFDETKYRDLSFTSNFVCPQANMIIAVEVTKVKIQKRVSQREYGGHEKDCEACKTQFFMDGLFPRS